MARTSKKATAVMVATGAEAATDMEIRSVGEVVANMVAALPAPEAEAGTVATRLDWVAVDHWNTDNPHTHIVLRGRHPDGSDRRRSRSGGVADRVALSKPAPRLGARPTGQSPA